ncbi:serine/threonine-protein kinase BLUS1-like [Daucus carota subsp. sativus]|uniref:serine/threonine-protein kinase BLUS1-like n=1 Tax=Daucus carota subsp. sativus TaxID=79200 RepID=UPI0007F0220D|nr:PREDICTED: serine/threonine-protein kinase BLUS1-like [Daucus carota subsp. sativus]
MEKKKFPIGPQNYTLYEEIGQGVSASVFRALCIPHNEVVAIKILDFERDNCDLNSVSREAQIMNLVDHPNVLKSHCSFVSDHNLWVIMPYMAGGSCLHILKAAYPEGFQEVVIATIMREVLKALEYLHHHGHIHRDVKAGNVLIDTRGAIKLGDFGVSACLFDSGDRQRTRNTFVGTPCWMAPEVMEQVHGYDFKADIWSFGITALELAHGHAPFSKYPPMKVLLMTLQNAPPGLDYERDRKFSKSFKQMIASCLVKDPSKRPSAKKLLKHTFFKQARSQDYIARKVLEGLPDLGDRIQELKRKEEDMLAQKKIPDGQKEEISQNEYKRGISGWDFNLEDVKAQASLIPDEDIIHDKEVGESSSAPEQEKQLQCQNSSPGLSSEAAESEDNTQIQNRIPAPSVDSTGAITNNSEKPDDDMSLASSYQGLHVSENNSPSNDNITENSLAGKPDSENNGKEITHPHSRKGSSYSIMVPDPVLSASKVDSDKMKSLFRSLSNLNGPHVATDDSSCESVSKASKTSASSEDLDEKVKPVVQQRGRFKVTSENVDLEKVVAAPPSPALQKSISMQVIPQHPSICLPSPSTATSLNHLGHSLFPTLQSVLQTNILQREGILSLMKQLSDGDPSAVHVVDGGVITSTTGTDKSSLEAAHDREKELLSEVTDLQWRLICAQEELKKHKAENAQV